MADTTFSVQEGIARAIADELQAQAAARMPAAHSRELLGRLAAFEQSHDDRLVELSRSLREEGRYVEYRPATLDDFLPLVGGPAAQEWLEAMGGPADVLRAAIGDEKAAQALYTRLAGEVDDPIGQAMFRWMAGGVDGAATSHTARRGRARAPAGMPAWPHDPARRGWLPGERWVASRP